MAYQRGDRYAAILIHCILRTRHCLSPLICLWLFGRGLGAHVGRGRQRLQWLCARAAEEKRSANLSAHAGQP